MGDCRSTRLLHNQLFAAATTRSGCSLATRLAYSPTIPIPFRIPAPARQDRPATLPSIKTMGAKVVVRLLQELPVVESARPRPMLPTPPSGAKASTEFVVPKIDSNTILSRHFGKALKEIVNLHPNDAPADYCDKCFLQQLPSDNLSRSSCLFNDDFMPI